MRLPLKNGSTFFSTPFIRRQTLFVPSQVKHDQYRHSNAPCKKVTTIPTVHTYAQWLKPCTDTLALHKGSLIHVKIVRDGLESEAIVGSALVNMYSKCGSLEDACKVFAMVPIRDVVLWSAIIIACANHKQAQEGVRLFDQMQKEGICPDKFLYAHALKACSGIPSLEHGKRIYIDITKRGVDMEHFVGSGIVDMYTKCGSIKDALKVFDAFLVRDVVLWSAMLCGCVEYCYYAKSLELYKKMGEEGVEPNIITYKCILKACTAVEALHEGKDIHANIVRRALHDSSVGIVLVHMYCKCGDLEDAYKVFHTFTSQDVVAWSVLISGFAEVGHGAEALKLYQNMRLGGVTRLDEVISICVLKVCSQIAALKQGTLIHFDLILEGLDSGLCVERSLLDMYIKCGSLDDARSIFDKLPARDVVTCSALISGYALHGHGSCSLELFESMQRDKIEPNDITFASVLKACASVFNVNYGRLIHNQVITRGLDSDLFVGSTLINMYASSGSIEEAYNVFAMLPIGCDNVLWNTMIGAYVESDHNDKALELFRQMCYQGVALDKVTLMWIIRASPSIEQGRFIHALAVKHGADTDSEVQNTLISMHGKIGDPEDAEAIFRNLANKTMASYNAILAGCAQHGCGEQALELFGEMNGGGIVPDQTTLVSVLKSCSLTADLYNGMLVHAEIVEQALDGDSFVANTALDLYAKGGSLQDALKVFDRLPYRDIVTWNIIVAAYADHGHCDSAHKSIILMQQEGINPDNGTFICVFHACSHAGLVPLGYQYFQAMEDYGVTPTTQHCACLIDALGRAGLVDEAKELTLRLPIEPNVVLWTSILDACLKHGFMEVGLHAYDLFTALMVRPEPPLC